MAAFIRDCNDCNKAKIGVHLPPPPVRYPPCPQLFEVFQVDLVGPLPTDGDVRYLLKLVDRSSRWIQCELLVDIFVSTVAEAFIRVWVARYGMPRQLVSNHRT